MKSRLSLILEIVWIIIGIVCLAGTTRSLIIKDNSNILIFVIMAVVSFGFAWFRHNQRRKEN